jgi:hypothetical protein
VFLQNATNVFFSSVIGLPIPEITGDTPFLENAAILEGFNNHIEERNRIMDAIPYRNALRYTFSAWVISKGLEAGISVLGSEGGADFMKNVSTIVGALSLVAFAGYQYKMSQTNLWENHH